MDTLDFTTPDIDLAEMVSAHKINRLAQDTDINIKE